MSALLKPWIHSSITPAGPKRMFPLSFLLSLRRDPLNFLSQLAEYGDLAHFKIGGQKVYFLNHPDFIKDVLVTNSRNFAKGRALQMTRRLLGNGLLTSEGEFHLRQRRLSQPAFHRQRITAYGNAMVEQASQQRERWQHGETLDIATEMNRLTLAIVGKTLFDADVETAAKDVGEALTTAMEMFPMMMLPFARFLEKLPLPAMRRLHYARETLDTIIYRIIEEHRTNGNERGDLLSMLLQTQDEEGDRMTDEQVRDEALTIFLAGHETTANALTWTWFLLSQNPDVEAKFHAEIDSLLAGRTPTTEDLPRLKYTYKVFAESMRLYPPAWVIGRRALHDFKLDGYLIPAGSMVVMSQFVMHRDARFFSRPLQFDPERWNAEEKERLPKFAYFPFGGGPRQCIGEGFAWMEGILLLATLAQRWRLRLVAEQRVALQPLVTLRPRYGMQMTVEAR